MDLELAYLNSPLTNHTWMASPYHMALQENTSGPMQLALAKTISVAVIINLPALAKTFKVSNISDTY